MKHLKPIIAILTGVALGMFLFLVQFSNMPSYLSTDPKACINCHVMDTAYTSWRHSTHNQVACVSCHMPQDSLVDALYAKAVDGMKHAYFFTVEDRENFGISEDGARRVQKNCVSCHTDLMQVSQSTHQDIEARMCWDCHREAPHGSVRGQSSTPFGITLQHSLKEDR